MSQTEPTTGNTILSIEAAPPTLIDRQPTSSVARPAGTQWLIARPMHVKIRHSVATGNRQESVIVPIDLSKLQIVSGWIQARVVEIAVIAILPAQEIPTIRTGVAAEIESEIAVSLTTPGLGTQVLLVVGTE